MWLDTTNPGTLKLERRSQSGTYGIPNSLDYADESYAVTISAISGATLSMTSASSIVVGSVINQSSTYAKVLAKSTNDILVTSATGLTTGAATSYTPYSVVVRFVSDFAGQPDSRKHYTDQFLLFQKRAFYSGSSTFSSDNFTTTQSVTCSFPDKTMVLPRDIAALLPLKARKVTIPTENQRCTYLVQGFTLNEAFGFFRLAGYVLGYGDEGDRINTSAGSE
jgi:hypothetical protein